MAAENDGDGHDNNDVDGDDGDSDGSDTASPRALEHILSEGAGDEWQAPIGHGSGVWSRALKIFISTPLDCMKGPSLNIKIHLSLNIIDHLLYDIIH